MTPEERAQRFSWKQCPGGRGHDAGYEGAAFGCAKCNADVIRAAEDEVRDETIESLACLVERSGGFGSRQSMRSLAEHLRGFKGGHLLASGAA